MTSTRLTKDLLRKAAADRVEETNLRETADEIGMSFSGLASFLRGGSPQKKTLTKLVAWYYQRTAHANAPSLDDLDVAIAQLQVYINDRSKPQSVRDRRKEEIDERLRE